MRSSTCILGLALLGYVAAFEAVVVAVGASITWGLHSPQGDGYRIHIQNETAVEGNVIQMVGTRHSGAMVEKNSEGYPGDVIHQVGEKITANFNSLQNKPSIVVTLLGTNDCNPANPASSSLATAPDRFDYYLGRYKSLCSDCVIIAAALPPNKDTQWNSNINTYNAGIKAKVQARIAKNEKIIWMDNHLQLSDLGPDGTHPTGQGYQLLGQHFKDQINSAYHKGWIAARSNVNPNLPVP